MIVTSAGVDSNSQRTVGRPRGREPVVEDAEVGVEDQPEHGRVGYRPEHERREEGEAVEALEAQQVGVEGHRQGDGEREHQRNLEREDRHRVAEGVPEGRVLQQPAPVEAGSKVHGRCRVLTNERYSE
jgi:hypothetical protein